MKITHARAALSGLALLVLASCATPRDEMTPELWQQFRDGRIVQDCSAACLPSWIASTSGIAKTAYDKSDWRGLAETVILSGYRTDQIYFYLGRAAEGLGHAQAAIRYYQLSLSLHRGTDQRFHCSSSKSEMCDGLPIESLTVQRLAALQAARRPASQQRPRPGTPAQIELPPARELELPPPRR